jgi:hypothetical protein
MSRETLPGKLPWIRYLLKKDFMPPSQNWRGGSSSELRFKMWFLRRQDADSMRGQSAGSDKENPGMSRLAVQASANLRSRILRFLICIPILHQA